MGLGEETIVGSVILKGRVGAVGITGDRDHSLQAVRRDHDDDAVLEDANDVGILDYALLFEEEHSVQLHRCTAAKLRKLVPLVEIAADPVDVILVEHLWVGGIGAHSSGQQSVHNNVWVSNDSM